MLYAGGDYMPLLQVRECPEDIYRRISHVAKNENRTIAQQVAVLLEKGLEQQESNIGRRKRLMDRLEKRHIASEIKKIDPVSLIREDRNR